MGKSKKNKSKQETPEAEAVPAPPPVEDPEDDDGFTEVGKKGKKKKAPVEVKLEGEATADAPVPGPVELPAGASDVAAGSGSAAPTATTEEGDFEPSKKSKRKNKKKGKGTKAVENGIVASGDSVPASASSPTFSANGLEPSSSFKGETSGASSSRVEPAPPSAPDRDRDGFTEVKRSKGPPPGFEGARPHEGASNLQAQHAQEQQGRHGGGSMFSLLMDDSVAPSPSPKKIPTEESTADGTAPSWASTLSAGGGDAKAAKRGGKGGRGSGRGNEEGVETKTGQAENGGKRVRATQAASSSAADAAGSGPRPSLTVKTKSSALAKTGDAAESSRAANKKKAKTAKKRTTWQWIVFVLGIVWEIMYDILLLISPTVSRRIKRYGTPATTPRGKKSSQARDQQGRAENHAERQANERHGRGAVGARQRAVGRKAGQDSTPVPDELKGVITAADWEKELRTFQRAQLLRSVAQNLEGGKAAEMKAKRAAKAKGKQPMV